MAAFTEVPRMPTRTELDKIDATTTDLRVELNELNNQLRGVTKWRPTDTETLEERVENLRGIAVSRDECETLAMFVLNMKALLEFLTQEIDELEQTASPLFYEHYYDFMPKPKS